MEKINDLIGTPKEDTTKKIWEYIYKEELESRKRKFQYLKEYCQKHTLEEIKENLSKNSDSDEEFQTSFEYLKMCKERTEEEWEEAYQQDIKAYKEAIESIAQEENNLFVQSQIDLLINHIHALLEIKMKKKQEQNRRMSK